MASLIMGEDRDVVDGINYVTTTAEPSRYPSRNFCIMCGHLAKYACTRCGSKYCAIRCLEDHKETGCLKFAF